MTDSHQDLKTDKEPNKENRFFASVIAHLPQGIIVCNARGEILLYNKPVNAILKLEEDHGAFPFLGQMVTALIDKNLIEHTLDEINERLKRVRFPERDLTPLLEYYREKFRGRDCYGGLTR